MARKIKVVHPATGMVKQFDESAGLLMFFVLLRYWAWAWPLPLLVARRWVSAAVGVAFLAAISALAIAGADPLAIVCVIAVYCTIGIFVGLHAHEIGLKSSLQAGWEFAEPESASARRAGLLLGFQQSPIVTPIRYAIICLWIGVGVGIFQAVSIADAFYQSTFARLVPLLDGNTDMATKGALAETAAMGGIILILPLLTVLCILKIRVGRKWARVLLVPLAVVVTLVPIDFVYVHAVRGSLGNIDAFVGGYEVVWACLYILATYLLFAKPGRDWFGDRWAAAAAEPDATALAPTPISASSPAPSTGIKPVGSNATGPMIFAVCVIVTVAAIFLTRPKASAANVDYYTASLDQFPDVDVVRQQADAGNTAAQAGMGRLYVQGHGVAKDDAAAFKWFLLAAQNGDVYGQSMACTAYWMGRGIKKNHREAVAWCLRAAQRGDAGSEGLLSLAYVRGDGVAADYDVAFKWAKASSDQGNAYGEFMLGDLYFYGVGTDKNDDEAMSLFRKSAGQGFQPAIDFVKAHQQ